MIVQARKGGTFYEATYCNRVRLCAELHRIWNALLERMWSVVEKDAMQVDIAVQKVPYFLVSSSRLVRLQPSPHSTTLPHSTQILDSIVKKVA